MCCFVCLATASASNVIQWIAAISSLHSFSSCQTSIVRFEGKINGCWLINWINTATKGSRAYWSHGPSWLDRINTDNFELGGRWWGGIWLWSVLKCDLSALWGEGQFPSDVIICLITLRVKEHRNVIGKYRRNCKESIHSIRRTKPFQPKLIKHIPRGRSDVCIDRQR